MMSHMPVDQPGFLWSRQWPGGRIFFVNIYILYGVVCKYCLSTLVFEIVLKIFNIIAYKILRSENPGYLVWGFC